MPLHICQTAIALCLPFLFRRGKLCTGFFPPRRFRFFYIRFPACKRGIVFRVAFALPRSLGIGQFGRRLRLPSHHGLRRCLLRGVQFGLQMLYGDSSRLFLGVDRGFGGSGIAGGGLSPRRFRSGQPRRLRGFPCGFCFAQRRFGSPFSLCLRLHDCFLRCRQFRLQAPHLRGCFVLHCAGFRFGFGKRGFHRLFRLFPGCPVRRMLLRDFVFEFGAGLLRLLQRRLHAGRVRIGASLCGQRVLQRRVTGRKLLLRHRQLLLQGDERGLRILRMSGLCRFRRGFQRVRGLCTPFCFRIPDARSLLHFPFCFGGGKHCVLFGLCFLFPCRARIQQALLHPLLQCGEAVILLRLSGGAVLRQCGIGQLLRRLAFFAMAGFERLQRGPRLSQFVAQVQKFRTVRQIDNACAVARRLFRLQPDAVVGGRYRNVEYRQSGTVAVIKADDAHGKAVRTLQAFGEQIFEVFQLIQRQREGAVAIVAALRQARLMWQAFNPDRKPPLLFIGRNGRAKIKRKRAQLRRFCQRSLGAADAVTPRRRRFLCIPADALRHCAMLPFRRAGTALENLSPNLHPVK